MAEVWFALVVMIAAAALLCSLVVYFNSGEPRAILASVRAGTTNAGEGGAEAAAA